MTIRRIANAAALILLSLFLLACSLPGEKPGAPTAGDTTVSAAESAKQALALADAARQLAAGLGKISGRRG